MSIEVTLFVLRLLAGICLVAFLLALLFLIWRNLNVADPQMQMRHHAYGYLTSSQESESELADGGDRFALQPITTFGRSPGNSIIVRDDFASANHAQIVLKDGQWWLEDRGSRNGTRLNGEPIDGPAILTGGDVICIGRYHYTLALAL